MKITNIEDTYKVEQVLLRSLQSLTNDYRLGNPKLDDNRLRAALLDFETGFMELRIAMRNETARQNELYRSCKSPDTKNNNKKESMVVNG